MFYENLTAAIDFVHEVIKIYGSNCGLNLIIFQKYLSHTE